MQIGVFWEFCGYNPSYESMDAVRNKASFETLSFLHKVFKKALNPCKLSTPKQASQIFRLERPQTWLRGLLSVKFDANSAEAPRKLRGSSAEAPRKLRGSSAEARVPI